ncbi:hypothetical protein ACGFS9_17095 [Streptomyces sp. NPDC048566]|uniref:hypothetical protein n=1 Tax=Streptomyces sp. NPDC048566 TaxID=3365569 RepID=UPI00371CEF61
MRASAFVVLSALAVTSCKDTTINQKAGGDAEACVQGAVCSPDRGSADAPEDTAAAESAAPPDADGSADGPSVQGDGGGDGGGEGAASGGERAGGARGDRGQDGTGTGSVQGEAVPVSVALSGGNLPEGLKDSADGCVMGTCTSWNTGDVVIGGKTFDTGFLVACTIACGGSENGYFQMKLAGRYATLDATFGIAADSPGSDTTETLKVNLVDQGTGRVLYAQTLEYGRSHALRGFDVSHVGLLRISFEGALGRAHGAVGAPVVRR